MAAIGQLIADETWERHANPWSVWTRYAAFPFLIAALWSSHAIGWWSLLPTALVVVFLVINPRLFAAPRSTRNWASMAVLGERVWLMEGRRFLPDQGRGVFYAMMAASIISVPALAFGVYSADIPLTMVAMLAILIGKTWFNDRMVWLFSVRKDQNPIYASWLR
jgi:hypothetical protein